MIFGMFGKIGVFYRTTIRTMLISMFEDSGRTPEKLADDIWHVITERFDSLELSQGYKEGHINRLARILVDDPNELDLLCEQGREASEIAIKCIADLIPAYSRQGLALPNPVCNFCADLVQGKIKLSKRGRPPSTVRDEKIAMVIEVVLACHSDLKATRNETTDADCVCSIVCEMLNDKGCDLTEGRIEQIYNTYRLS